MRKSLGGDVRKLLNRKIARDLQFPEYCTIHTYVHVLIIYKGSSQKKLYKLVKDDKHDV